MDGTTKSEKRPESVAYAKQRQQCDRRWSTIYWFLHNTCVGSALVSQLLIVFGLALMLYIPDQQRNSANVTLLLISFVGLALALLDVVLGFGRRSRLLTRTADTIELSLSLYGDGAISADEFSKNLSEIVTLRQQQHDE